MVPGEPAREFARKAIDIVEFHLFRELGTFSEGNLVLFALSMTHNWFELQFGKTWQCFGMAMRLMLGLQLNWDIQPKTRSFRDKECARRVAWQLFNLDRLMAHGYEEYIACRDDLMKLRLPCTEQAFEEDRPVVVERLQEQPKAHSVMGLHAYQIRLLDIRHRILVDSRKKMYFPPPHNIPPPLNPAEVIEEVNKYQNELNRFKASLPSELRLTEANITNWMMRKDRLGFVTIHTWFCQLHIDLYRFTIPGIREQGSIDLLRKLPSDFIAKCRRQAVAHAICFATLCDRIQNEVERHPRRPGRSNLAADHLICITVSQAAKMLLAAMQHELYRDVTKHATVALVAEDPPNHDAMRKLVGALLRVLKPQVHLLPGVALQVRRARLAG